MGKRYKQEIHRRNEEEYIENEEQRNGGAHIACTAQPKDRHMSWAK